MFICTNLLGYIDRKAYVLSSITDCCYARHKQDFSKRKSQIVSLSFLLNLLRRRNYADMSTEKCMAFCRLLECALLAGARLFFGPSTGSAHPGRCLRQRPDLPPPRRAGSKRHRVRFLSKPHRASQGPTQSRFSNLLSRSRRDRGTGSSDYRPAQI